MCVMLLLCLCDDLWRAHSECVVPQSALRQAVYLAIKELAASAEDVIMVTASIMKDIQPNSEVIYRPNAIRALCKIIDVCFCCPFSPINADSRFGCESKLLTR